MTYRNTIFFVNLLFFSSFFSFSFFFSVEQLFSAMTFTNACRASLGFCKVIIVDPLAVCILSPVQYCHLSCQQLSIQCDPLWPHLSLTQSLSSSHFSSLSFFLPWARPYKGQGDTGPSYQSCKKYRLLIVRK